MRLTYANYPNFSMPVQMTKETKSSFKKTLTLYIFELLALEIQR